tara:strand:+ start:139 stop:351 length:213 start_codon:yes stop_codon:yes gene_type:complete
MKYVLEEHELQEISDKLRHLLEVKYKDEIGDIPEHVKNTICQNYILQCKNNKIDLDKILDENKIAIEVIE